MSLLTHHFAHEGRQADAQTERQASPESAEDRTGPASALNGRRGWLFGLFLIIATMAAYQPVWHAGFIWNDDAWITQNPMLHSLHGLWQIWFEPDAPIQYYPLTLTTFWLEYHLWGLNPLGYHLINVLFHTFNALLLWFILRRLNVSAAWLAACFFALHPVCVESVAWVTERKNTLSGLFYLSAILVGLKFWLSNEGAEPAAKEKGNGLGKGRYYWLTLGFYACALWSKTTTIPLPAVLLLLVWWKRGKVERQQIFQMLPFVAVGMAMGLVTMHVEKLGGAADSRVGDSVVGGPFWVRPIIAARDVWFYLWKLIWPHPLIFVYPRWKVDATQAVEYVPGLGLSALFIILWIKRKRWGRPILVGLTYFVMLSFLALGFFNVYYFQYSFVGDHFQYLASIGPLTLVAAGMFGVIDFFEKGKVSFKGAICGALLLGLGVLTWQQCRMYADEETLWEMTIAKNPDCLMAYNNLGNILSQKGRLDEALAIFQKALEIDPDDGKVHYNLGGALLQKGKVDEAIAHFQKAIEIDPHNPAAQDDLGSALLQKGEIDEAIVHFQKSLEINPDNATVHYNLGIALLKKGEMDEAIAHFQRALEINPDDPAAWNDLGSTIFLKGRPDEAIAHFQKALEIKPDYVKAQNNLAWVLATCPQASLRDGNKAVELAQRANQLTDGENPLVLRTLAAAYAEAGRFPEAVETAQRALQLARAQSNIRLADALQSQMKFYEAGQPFQLR